MEKLKISFNLFHNKKVIVTGLTGFKGSWLTLLLQHFGADVHGISLKEYSNIDNYVITGLKQKKLNYYTDIRNSNELKKIFSEIQPEFVFHLAAQPLVLNSYSNPIFTYETNVIGTLNVLECCRFTASIKSVIIVTSDKCYDNKEQIWGYKESDAFGGKDPYSASKGCTEILTQSHISSYFQNLDTTNVASVRAGNVIGGGDWCENRIVPDFFRSLNNNDTLTVRNPNATRPWQFVLEPLFGYLKLSLFLYETFGVNKTYQGGWNFGPEFSNNVSVEILINKLIEKSKKGSFETPESLNKLYEASLLHLDITKAKHYLNWKPVLDLDETIDYTIDSYLYQHLNQNSGLENRQLIIEKYLGKQEL